jgi:[histone H3]-lysine27 N-trimethyltransferase EZH2
MAKVTSTQTDVEDKSSGGALSRKKSSGRRRIKCSQSESASSNARIISESSDSENGPGRDAASGSHSAPPKTKPVGKSGIGKRNSKRVAERVLVCMQKRQKKTVASDSDSIVSSILCSSDMHLSSIITKIIKKQLFYYTNVSNFLILKDPKGIDL